jgi:cytochrome d ubiquinol oxidase subunit I
MDVVWLSRLQFALTVGFHYLFPPLTIGMGVVLVYLEAMYLRTRQQIYETAARFWTGLFGLSFAVGVATGIVMEFQFGTNWAAYSRFVGDVFGSALAAEGIFAFFLESGFLAVLVFGWDKVSARMHFLATCLVSVGSMFSAVWIVVANSWQQTPAGHHIVQVLRNGQPLLVDGQPATRAEIVDFWAMVFNPSSMYRLGHVLIGAFIMGSFFIMSISAYYLIRHRHEEFARRSFSGALIFATIASLGALVQGHFQADGVYEHQPAKLAAFEGHFQTGPAGLSIFGIPDPAARELRYDLSVPGGLSFLIHEDFQAPVVGLDRFRREDWPPLLLAFTSYHVMVGLGVLFIALTLLAGWMRWRGALFRQRWLLWVFVFAVAGPVLANEAGWLAAEVGRQPWIVHPPVHWRGDDVVVGPQGVVAYDETVALRTTAAVSPTVGGGQVLGSMIGFGLIYLALGAIWIIVLDHKIRQGPRPAGEGVARGEGGAMGTASRWLGHQESLTGASRDEEAGERPAERGEDRSAPPGGSPGENGEGGPSGERAGG